MHHAYIDCILTTLVEGGLLLQAGHQVEGNGPGCAVVPWTGWPGLSLLMGGANHHELAMACWGSSTLSALVSRPNPGVVIPRI